MMITARGGTGTTITTPAGWTLLQTALNSGTALKGAFFWKLAASEPASYTVTLTSSKATGVIIALSGAATTAPIAAQLSGQVNASSATIAAAALGTFPAKNGIDLFFGGTAIGTSAAAPTNYTLAAEETNSAGNANTRSTTGGSYRSLTNITTVGALSATYGTAAVNIGYHLFIYEQTTAPTAGTTTTLATLTGKGILQGSSPSNSTLQGNLTAPQTISRAGNVITNTILAGTIRGLSTILLTGSIQTNTTLNLNLISKLTGSLYTSTTTALNSTPLQLKYWNGTAWLNGTVKVWNGSAWVGHLRKWNGTNWT